MNHDKLDIVNNVDVFTSYCAPGFCESFSLNISHRYRFFLLLLENRSELFATGHKGLLLRRFGWFRNSRSAQGKSWPHVAT